MKLTQYLTFKNLLIAGLIIFVLLLLRRCDGANKRLEKIIAANTRLNEQKKQDSLIHLAERARWEDSITHAGINSDLQVKVIQEQDKKLQASQSRISQLTAIIRNSSNNSNGSDSSFVLVSPDYKQACDSLPDEIDKQNTLIADLKESNEGLQELMNYETVYRDSLIEAEQQQVAALNSTIASKDKIIEQAMKPRGRFLAGAGLIGNQTTFLSGAKVAFAYQTGGGKQYQGGAMVMNKTLYYEGTILITLFK
jgi:hypothetical protein